MKEKRVYPPTIRFPILHLSLSLSPSLGKRNCSVPRSVHHDLEPNIFLFSPTFLSQYALYLVLHSFFSMAARGAERLFTALSTLLHAAVTRSLMIHFNQSERGAARVMTIIP